MAFDPLLVVVVVSPLFSFELISLVKRKASASNDGRTDGRTDANQVSSTPSFLLPFSIECRDAKS